MNDTTQVLNDAEQDKEARRRAYAAKVEGRRDRLQNRADKAAAASDALFTQSREMAAVIPLGQPILIGHHSEKRDRNYRQRIQDKGRKGLAEGKKAESLQAKADRVGTGGISSDDPDAVDKLEEKLAKLQANQEIMKNANRIIRKKNLSDAQKLAELIKAGLSEKTAKAAQEPDDLNRVGFPAYILQNNNANIKSVQERIEKLKELQQRVDREVATGTYTYREDSSENRILFIFDGKPEENIRNTLKNWGFKWSPSRGAWVRMLNANGLYAAKRVNEALQGTPQN